MNGFIEQFGACKARSVTLSCAPMITQQGLWPPSKSDVMLLLPPSVSDRGFSFLSPGICFSLTSYLPLFSLPLRALCLPLCPFRPQDFSLRPLFLPRWALCYAASSASCRRRRKRAMRLSQTYSSALPLSEQ